MKNVEKLANYITKNGSEDMLIHTLSGSGNWVIAQKIENDTWILTLADPMGDVTYNLGTVSDKDHIALWIEITRMGIENKAAYLKKPTTEDERVELEKKISEVDSGDESKTSLD